WEQARNCMFDIQNSFQRKFYMMQTPWFSYMVSFPFIRKAEWTSKFGKDSAAFDEIIFKDDISSLAMLKHKVIERAIPPGSDKPVNNPIDAKRIKHLRAVFGDSAVLNTKRKARRVDEIKLGAELDRLEIMDKHLSEEQQELSNIKPDGKPRLIRGVAGSGKTVVLANIVATYIKSIRRRGIQDELGFNGGNKAPFKTAVVCYNKTLVPFIKEKIALSYQNQTGQELDFDGSLHVTHYDGFIKDILVVPGIVGNEIWSYTAMEEKTEYAKKSMAGYMAKGVDLDKFPGYDAIFIDEGQDLSEGSFIFFKDLLKQYENAKNENIIIFYDDAQNIYGNTRPNWSTLGIGIAGRSKVMKKCFRNTVPIITLAYNVLLGKKEDEGIKSESKQFADFDYLKNTGLVTEVNGIFEVSFAEREGPMPEVRGFDDFDSEVSWICETVKDLIENQHVRPDDIAIMSYKRRNCDKIADSLESVLGSSEKSCHIVRAHHHEEKNSLIFREDCVTVSTIHGAKGYDANIVFLAGIHELSTENMPNYDQTERSRHETAARAICYVGATRAKYMLHISGVKSEKESLLDEVERKHIFLQDRDIYKKN
ncbi:MAG: 3'-5' exonuclease, partial [bacterium]